MEEAEFLSRVKKVDGPREHKVRGSWGVYDAYKWYRKNKPHSKEFVLTESQYFTIIRRINMALREELLKGNDVKLPCKLGQLLMERKSRLISPLTGMPHLSYGMRISNPMRISSW